MRSNAFARARRPLRAAPRTWRKALADTRYQLERLEEARAQAQAEATRRQELFADTKAKLGASRAELEQARQRDCRARSRDRRSRGGAAGARQRPSKRAGRSARTRSRARAIWPRAREDFDQQRREHQERVAAARVSAEQHRDAAQAIAIKVESRRSSKESASAALLRVQSQLAHLTKRQQELRAEVQAAGAPRAYRGRDAGREARRAPARRGGSRQGAPGDGRNRHSASRNRAATQ